MICKNCGAKYNKKNLNCPYCGSENKIVAERRKREILESYDKEANEMEVSVPQKAIKSWTKYVVWGVGIVFVVLIIITLVTVIWGRLSAEFKYNKDQQQLERLE